MALNEPNALVDEKIFAQVELESFWATLQVFDGFYLLFFADLLHYLLSYGLLTLQNFNQSLLS